MLQTSSDRHTLPICCCLLHVFVLCIKKKKMSNISQKKRFSKTKKKVRAPKPAPSAPTTAPSGKTPPGAYTSPLLQIDSLENDNTILYTASYARGLGQQPPQDQRYFREVSPSARGPVHLTPPASSHCSTFAESPPPKISPILVVSSPEEAQDGGLNLPQAIQPELMELAVNTDAPSSTDGTFRISREQTLLRGTLASVVPTNVGNSLYASSSASNFTPIIDQGLGLFASTSTITAPGQMPPPSVSDQAFPRPPPPHHGPRGVFTPPSLPGSSQTLLLGAHASSLSQ